VLTNLWFTCVYCRGCAAGPEGLQPA
jgi:hypothetical protein